MMRLTDAAANRIKSVMVNAGRPIVGVRVGVKNGAAAGMAYTMEYARRRSGCPTRWSRTRACVLIDPKAVFLHRDGL